VEGRWDETLAVLSEETLESLVRETELGDLNFRSVSRKLRAIRRVLEALSAEDVEDLPANLVNEVDQHTAALKRLLGAMRAFTLTEDGAARQRQSIEQQVEQEREWFADRVRPHLRGDVVDIASRAREIKEAHDEALSAATEIQQILAQVRRSAGEAGAAQLSKYYAEQAERHDRTANRFLFGVVLSLAISLAAIGAMFVWLPVPVGEGLSPEARWEEFLRSLIVRLLVLGLLSYVVTFLVRNYRTNKHLQVTNEAKRNALDTFALFSEAAPTEEVRGIAVAELMRAVFGPTETGYLSESRERTVIETPPTITGLMGVRPPGQ